MDRHFLSSPLLRAHPVSSLGPQIVIMSGDDCWGAFGSDSDSEDDDDAAVVGSGDGVPTEQDPFEPAADSVALALTQRFALATKSSGVPLKDRVVGIGCCCGDDGLRRREALMGRVAGRGMKVMGGADAEDDFICDAAIMLTNGGTGGVGDPQSSRTRRSLLPGGFLWLVISLGGEVGQSNSGVAISKRLEDYPESIWDVGNASIVYESSSYQVISVQKRSCLVNAWSCPWMEKGQTIPKQVSATLDHNDDFPTSADGEAITYLEHERRAASAATIVASVAERTRAKLESSTSAKPSYATILTDANVQRATEIMRRHGFVVIKGLLPPSQTIPWGEAVLSDFESAVKLLRNHLTRPVDLMNPHASADSNEERAFEPLNYKEMAMREDLRVDLRSGPDMEALRSSQNDQAMRCMARASGDGASALPGLNDGPTMIRSDTAGTVESWRFHPSILAMIKAIFNPRDDTLSKGNFGRWNFGGSGPDGTPQPFRLGQIGSVLSCPGSGDQAVHADTPHLFENVDCLPCHYLNVFTPGYDAGVISPPGACFENELHEGMWTGNSTIGGTAVVHGSHMLSVTAQLLSEDDAGAGGSGVGHANGALDRRQLLQLRTVRPALEAGDALFFDCRTIHWGLANTSRRDEAGGDANAGRRPMLYLNVTQSWFHDPKNWDAYNSLWSSGDGTK